MSSKRRDGAWVVGAIAMTAMTALVALASLAPPLGAQAVTLPIGQYEELRARARDPEPETIPPPAPVAVESATLEITTGPESARVLQRLQLTLLAEGWQRVPIGRAGSFLGADFGGLEGRVAAAGDGWAIEVRGVGRHEVRLESVVPLARDEGSTRTRTHFELLLPPAAVVQGTLRAPAPVESVELASSGVVWPDGTGSWRFLAAPGAVTFVLAGRDTLPERARLPLRYEATSLAALALSRTQLRVTAWVEARVAQGRIAELILEKPADLEVVSVGGSIAGWNVRGNEIVVAPLEPVEESLALTVELAGAPRAPVAPLAPLVGAALVPRGSSRTTTLVRAALRGDGLLPLVDPTAVRTASAAEAASLPEALRSGAGRLWLVVDPQRPPRWQVEWSERAPMLAAQIDRLLVDVAIGESGRVGYQLWAEVRNRGAQSLALTLPSGFELLGVRRDGEEMAAGQSGGEVSVPLAVRETPQTVYLAGLLTLPLPPPGGRLELPLPGLSAPASRIEVRVLLPGGRSYRLSDPTRAAAIQPPPAPADAAATAKIATANRIAQQVLAARADCAVGASGLFERLPGFDSLTAAWSALSASPGPLRIEVGKAKESYAWF